MSNRLVHPEGVGGLRMVALRLLFATVVSSMSAPFSIQFVWSAFLHPRLVNQIAEATSSSQANLWWTLDYGLLIYLVVLPGLFAWGAWPKLLEKIGLDWN